MTEVIAPMPADVVNKLGGVVVNVPDVVNTVVNRQVQWQRKNRDRYNAKMREYMKRRRVSAR